MKSNGDSLRIGDLAARFGLAPNVLRHWESRGLLTPARVEGDRRLYSKADQYRVAVILSAKHADFGLDDIREMVTSRPADRRHILGRRRAELDRRIAQLVASRDLIDGALGCEHEDFTQCTDFQSQLAGSVSLIADDPARGPESFLRDAT